MKWEFGLALYDMMKRDDRVFLLWGDVGGAIFKAHIEDFPDRTLNFGVMEQSMISFAAGMAIQGCRPICYSICPFLIERAFEQIKIDVDQMNLPVGIVGHSDASCGPTHEEVCARNMMALLPNIRSYFPQSINTMKAVMQKIDLDSPWMLKLETVKEVK